ncbi:MAG: hypothetical protein ACREL5_03445 [Gemmatimonadales bacterium]
MIAPTIWTPERLCAAADVGLAWLRSVRVGRYSTRFEIYRRWFAAPKAFPLSDGDRRLMTEALIGTLSLFWMARAHIESDPVIPRLRMTVQGRAGDAQAMSSEPWAAQFELTCLAIGRLIGFPRLHFGEPDLVIAGDAARYGLPLKRMTTARRRGWKERVRHAIGQLDRLDMSGIVIIEAAWPTIDSDPDPGDALDRAARICAGTADRTVGGHRVDAVVVVHFHCDWRPARDDTPLGFFTLHARIRSRIMPEAIRPELAQLLAAVGERIAARLASAGYGVAGLARSEK